MTKDFRQIQSELAKPFAPEDLEWRLQVTNKDKTRGMAVPYVTNRAIQDRLDDVVGVDNWHNDYKSWHGNGKKEAQLCGISIYLEERKDWLTKWDGAEDTAVEPVKGGLSDSMKRAAVQWGIGRVLYKMNTVWVDVEQKNGSTVIKSSERAKLDKAYMDMLKRLSLEPAKPGGLQSQLTPSPEEDIPQGAEPAPHQDPKAPTQQPKPQAQQPDAAPTGSGKVTEFPAPQRPQWQYKVETATVQPGMSRQSMSLGLVDPSGKKTRAFYPSVSEDLAVGAELCDATLELRKQGTVVFYLLKSYKIVLAEGQVA